MHEMVKEKISALVDGELDGIEAVRLLDRMSGERPLQAIWESYHLIGDALRNDLAPSGDVDLVQRLHRSLEKEPVPLRPARRMPAAAKPIAGFALAASVAVVAVLGVQRFTGDPSADGAAAGMVADLGAPAAGPMRRTPEQAALEARINGYLVNHSERAGNRMHGMLPYVRIVGYDTSR